MSEAKRKKSIKKTNNIITGAGGSTIILGAPIYYTNKNRRKMYADYDDNADNADNADNVYGPYYFYNNKDSNDKNIYGPYYFYNTVKDNDYTKDIDELADIIIGDNSSYGMFVKDLFNAKKPKKYYPNILKNDDTVDKDLLKKLDKIKRILLTMKSRKLNINTDKYLKIVGQINTTKTNLSGDEIVTLINKIKKRYNEYNKYSNSIYYGNIDEKLDGIDEITKRIKMHLWFLSILSVA